MGSTKTRFLVVARLSDKRSGRCWRTVCASASAFAVAALLSVAPAIAEEPAAENPDERTFFQQQVEPLLVAHCYECHSHEAGEASGGLVLDSRSGWEKGGDSGPAIVPKQPAASLVVKAIDYHDVSLQMPPDGKLDDDAVAVLTSWVRQGAFDPRVGSETAKAATIDLEAGRNFWSYRPIVDPLVPSVRNVDWPATNVDRFVLARLEREGLTPAEEADRATLIRRVYLDLTGLPPTNRPTRGSGWSIVCSLRPPTESVSPGAGSTSFATASR